MYKPGMHNGSWWLKLKADFVEGLTTGVNLLIIGATRNNKGFIECFILAVDIKEQNEALGDLEENMTFHAVDKTSSSGRTSISCLIII